MLRRLNAVVRNSATFYSVNFVLLSLSLLLLVQSVGTNKGHWQSELKQLELQQLRTLGARNVLEDNSIMVAKINNDAVSKESLVLAVVDELNKVVVEQNFELSQLLVHKEPLSAVKNVVSVVRVTFSVILPRADAVLELLGAVQLAAKWLPTEVRACTMLRVASQRALATTCVVDVYHFTEITS